jgi:hypothetical protein
MTPLAGVMGWSGPATRGIPSMKSSTSLDPSGENLGAAA